MSEVKQAGSLDALILAHRRYLTQITEMALLGQFVMTTVLVDLSVMFALQEDPPKL